MTKQSLVSREGSLHTNDLSAQTFHSFPDLVQLSLVGQTGRLTTVCVGARIQAIPARRHIGDPLGPLVVRDDRVGKAPLGCLEPDHCLYGGREGGGERFRRGNAQCVDVS